MLLLYGLQKALNAKVLRAIDHPGTYDLGPLDNCQGETRSSSCINMMYTPSNSDTDAIMQRFANKNMQRSGLNSDSSNAIRYEGAFDLGVQDSPKRKYGVVSVPDTQFVYDYVLYNPNTTAFAVSFEVNRNDNQFKYQLWYNTTVQRNGTSPYNTRVLGIMRGLDEAIIGYSGNKDANIDVTLKDWPKVPPKASGDIIISSLGPMFFFSAQMVIFINVLMMIVGEKEKKLREAMQVVGLRSEVYWLSWYLAYAVLEFFCVLVTMGMSYALGFAAFTNSNFFAMFFTFYIFNLSMLMLAFFICAVIRSTQAAVLTGVYVCVVGLILMGSLFGNATFTFIWWADSTTPVFKRLFTTILPFFNFGVLFIQISQLSAGSLNSLTGTYVSGPGFKFSDLYNPLPSQYIPSLDVSGVSPPVPAPVTFYYYMLLNLAIYFVLLVYADNVVPNEYGVRESMLFFLDPRYYYKLFISSRKGDSVSVQSWIKSLPAPDAPVEGEDTDVSAERESVRDPTVNYGLRVLDLKKVFRSGFLNRKKFTAVNSLCFGIKEGQVLALLGQNGAGKSTTMNILSGMMPKSAGDALLYDYPLGDQRSLRRIFGICPQHDILFDELSAVEHIKLYAGLKNIPNSEINALVESGLNAVKLYNVRNRPSRTYSGGMKRRLSVLIATIGNPKVVFFDEPTTGMDPVNRRHVWRYLERFKKGRVIILTSHSMEEADVLSDRVAVMAHGKLKALGNSIRLKSKFGLGYRFSMVVSNPQHVETVKKLVSEKFPMSVLEDDSAGSLIYNLPVDEVQAAELVPLFVEWLEAHQVPFTPSRSVGSESGSSSMTDLSDQKYVSAWGMSQTSLEEVFLKLIRSARVEQQDA
ncbi:ABC transporter A family member 1 [Zancudomyces culisetae]|uniref:ABC transporter A family member 1 n=1 Tax=Zancudomyces culisetae TaxID=1213189 RepID=A0A1R1PQ52_ZANCU|nr:ABC transporter A family member 1 [Zancudomyces culisetae]|eukprot:OMH83116.1 ABC transporter A family member 1 [Zancudomyces culisetae]